MVADIAATLGPVDILVNNAGIIKRIPMHEMAAEEFRQVIDIDLVAPYFTLAAQDVYTATGDAAVAIPAGFEAGSLDFASNPLAWVIFHLTHSCKWIGVTALVLITKFLMVLNRRAIIKYQNKTE